jgi:hypothetical protein
MSLNAASLENIEFPNNIFENANISPKYNGLNLPHIANQSHNPAVYSSNKHKNGRNRTI